MKALSQSQKLVVGKLHYHNLSHIVLRMDFEVGAYGSAPTIYSSRVARIFYRKTKPKPLFIRR
jgi:hypothetical protein